MAEIVLRRSYYPRVFVVRVINMLIGIVEFALAGRLVLELLGASTSSPFVEWVYTVTDALVQPFAGAFPALSVGSGSMIDVVAIFAMIGYAVIGLVVIQLLLFIFSSI